jgi:hypothetical protein
MSVFLPAQMQERQKTQRPTAQKASSFSSPFVVR